MPAGADFTGLLLVLARHGVEHVVIGGVAAILGGAPISTFDLDIVFRDEDANRERMLAALEELEALYRDPAGRRVRPDRERLSVQRLHLLSTSRGPLDLLTEIPPGWQYDDLLPRSAIVELGELTVRVLELRAVIESKAHAGSDKDRATLPVLRRALAERSRQ